MKLTALLVFVCLAVASASNIRGQEPELRNEVDAARAAETGATGVAAPSESTVDATGSDDTTDDKNAREHAKENAAAADESKAHKAAEEMIANSEKKWGEVKDNCATEQKETTDWIENPVVNVEKMTKRRLAAEHKLLKALESRVEGLRNFIKRIKLTRKRLRKRIISVNALFKLKFDENMANVGAATNVLADIGHLKLAPYNPKLNKIKQFKSFDTDTTSLIQMTEKAMKQGSCAEKDECSGATKLAFKAYRKGLELNKAMGVNFEKERVVFGMRDKIRALLTKKRQNLTNCLLKLNALKPQWRR